MGSSTHAEIMGKVLMRNVEANVDNWSRSGKQLKAEPFSLHRLLALVLLSLLVLSGGSPEAVVLCERGNRHQHSARKGP